MHQSRMRRGLGEGEGGDEADQGEEEAAETQGRGRSCGGSWVEASRCCAGSPCAA